MVPLVLRLSCWGKRTGFRNSGSGSQCMDELPAGFDYINGQYLNIDPIKAMFNDAWFPQALHMTVAAFCATGFAVAGVHAF